MSKIKIKLKQIIKFFADWRMAICFILAWMITNGWAYLFIAFGSLFEIKWMLGIGTGYIAILWLPCTPEKLITIPLSVAIKKLLFKKEKDKDGFNISN